MQIDIQHLLWGRILLRVVHLVVLIPVKLCNYFGEVPRLDQTRCSRRAQPQSRALLQEESVHRFQDHALAPRGRDPETQGRHADPLQGAISPLLARRAPRLSKPATFFDPGATNVSLGRRSLEGDVDDSDWCFSHTLNRRLWVSDTSIRASWIRSEREACSQYSRSVVRLSSRSRRSMSTAILRSSSLLFPANVSNISPS